MGGLIEKIMVVINAEQCKQTARFPQSHPILYLRNNEKVNIEQEKNWTFQGWQEK